jgi:hypothetical protein
VADKVGYTISKGRSAVRTIDRSNRTQAPKIIKEFFTLVVLAMKYPKLILRFGHEENLAHAMVPLLDSCPDIPGMEKEAFLHRRMAASTPELA